MSLFEIVERFREEMEDDYVGLWEIFRALQDTSPNEKRRELAISVVETLLKDKEVRIGQFSEGVFVPWSDTQDANIARLKVELTRLNKDPDIGDIAWLCLA